MGILPKKLNGESRLFFYRTKPSFKLGLSDTLFLFCSFHTMVSLTLVEYFVVIVVLFLAVSDLGKSFVFAEKNQKRVGAQMSRCLALAVT